MAFVFGKSKKQSLPRQEHSPGPGKYQPSDKDVVQASAPFHSSTIKTSQFDVLPTQTGPGSYNPPCRKDIQANNKKSHTSTFASKVQRFKTSPGIDRKSSNKMKVSLVKEESQHRYSQGKETGESKQAYIAAVSKAKEKMGEIQGANKKRKIDSISSNKELVRIILSNPKNTEVMHSVFVDPSIAQKHNGPGTYNLQNSSDLTRKRNSSVVDWSRSTQSRFNHKKNKTPGPGSYQSQKVPKKSNSSLSASFAYQGLRSCIDQMVYKTKMPFKVKVIEQKGLKDRYPGPGHYNPKKTSHKSFHYGDDGFGSTSFPNQEEPQDRKAVPGPGSYLNKNEKQVKKEQLRQTRDKIFGKTRIKTQKAQNLYERNKEEIRKQCLMEIERNKNKFYTLKERCNSKVGNFSHAQRWNRDNNPNPGPGKYYLQTTHAEPEHKPTAAFNPTEERFHPQSTEIQTAYIPFYNVDRNDIGNVAQRVKRNIQNLRQIDIDKAPFNTRQERFESQKKKKAERTQDDLDDSPEMVAWNPHHEEEMARLTLMKNTNKEQNQPSASFKSGTKRAWAVPSHFIGPGNYNQPSQMEKKSFNREYNYNPPIKIRATYRTHSSLS